eukprot:TRINITY_DN19847_c0_g2_i1.p1 TRINITY_DN19847_c0_g2~~TRINITY_DN19847_c0_g2_i1.p1  ORF type:complete len:397 (+),score=134.28 TRINITY_DN19847_c0_g2_i1:89-1192(+)
MSGGKKIGKWVVFEDTPLARGPMSKMLKAQSSTSGREVVCKKVDKSLLVNNLRQDELQKEIEILQRFRYRHVLQFYDVMQSKHSIYIVVEHSCGNLISRHAQGMTRELVREVFKQLVLAAIHVHSRGIAHREIHPGNVQLTPFDEVKLSGFTNATRISHPSQFIKHSNTAIRFIAPEILSPNPRFAPPPEKSDLWGLGVTLFYMENGRAPFDSGPAEELQNRICRGVYHMTREMAKDSKDICVKLISSDIARRASLDVLATNKHLAIDPASVAEAKGKHVEEEKKEDEEEVTVFNLGPCTGGGQLLSKIVLGGNSKEDVHKVVDDELPPLAPVTIRKMTIREDGTPGGVFKTHAANARPKKTPTQQP